MCQDPTLHCSTTLSAFGGVPGEIGNESSLRFDRVLIVGLGLLGGSFALALRSAGLGKQLLGWDCNPDHERQALARNLVSALWNPQDESEPFDLVFLAVPPSQMTKVLIDISPWVHSATLVMDACSVKTPVARAMVETLGSHSGLVPAHPVAGWHTSGPSSGRGDLFKQKAVVLSRLSNTSPRHFAMATALWRSFGARVVEMDPQEHDTLFALISHLPHLLAFSTMGLSLNKSVDLSLVGSGFLDSTRLAQCPPSLWVDIALANGDALALTLEAFIGELHDLEVNLRTKDAGSLAFKFHRAHQLRISMEAS